MTRETIAILGSGNGGHAVAAILGLAGHRIHLYGRHGFRSKLLPVKDSDGIELTGTAGSGVAPIALVTEDIRSALQGASIVVVVTRANEHEELAGLCAQHMADGQILVLLQGGAASLIFASALRSAGRLDGISIGETSTLPYTSRLLGPARVHVSRVSRRHMFAAFPGRDSHRVVMRLRQLFPFLEPASHVLETALYNPNLLLHPAGTLLNLGRIEHVHGQFRIYAEGFTNSVWTLVRALDAEKMAALSSLGVKPIPYSEEFAWRNTDTFDDFAALGIVGPSGPEDRYITEDVPYGLVLLASLGRRLQVETPICDSLIAICSAITRTDYWSTGRTLERLGLDELKPSEMRQHVLHGDYGSSPGRAGSTAR